MFQPSKVVQDFFHPLYHWMHLADSHLTAETPGELWPEILGLCALHDSHHRGRQGRPARELLGSHDAWTTDIPRGYDMTWYDPFPSCHHWTFPTKPEPDFPSCLICFDSPELWYDRPNGAIPWKWPRLLRWWSASSKARSWTKSGRSLPRLWSMVFCQWGTPSMLENHDITRFPREKWP